MGERHLDKLDAQFSDVRRRLGRTGIVGHVGFVLVPRNLFLDKYSFVSFFLPESEQ
jgi:hypothetical protein